MKEILILTPEESTYGFALSGVRQQIIVPQETWEALQEVCQDPEVGVVAVDARLLEKVDNQQLRELTKRWAGVLVTLPAPAGVEREPADELQRLVSRALGYHVRLQ